MELEFGLSQAELNQPSLLKGGHSIANPPEEVKFLFPVFVAARIYGLAYFLSFPAGWILESASASSLGSTAISSAASRLMIPWV